MLKKCESKKIIPINQDPDPFLNTIEHSVLEVYEADPDPLSINCCTNEEDE